MEFNQLLEALPLAASNPYAFTSYVFLIIAWVIVVFRIKRNKHLLKNLQKLPEKNRLEALKLEIHGVDLKEGITPEQWIKSKIHSYLFMGFLSICLVATVLTTIYILERKDNTSNILVEKDLTDYTARKKTVKIPGEESTLLTIDGKFRSENDRVELLFEYVDEVDHYITISVDGEKFTDREWVDRAFLRGICFSEENNGLEILYEIVSGGMAVFSDFYSFKYLKSENKFVIDLISTDQSNELSDFILCPPTVSYNTKLNGVGTYIESENWKVNEVACQCDYVKGIRDAENLSNQFFEFLTDNYTSKNPIKNDDLNEHIKTISLQSDTMPFEINDFEFENIRVMKIQYIHHHGWNFILARSLNDDYWTAVYLGYDSLKVTDFSEVCNVKGNELQLRHCIGDDCGFMTSPISLVSYSLNDWSIKSVVENGECPR